MPLLVSSNEGLGAPAQSRQGGVAPAVPDFLLPEIVEAFDLGLKAGLARWSKDGNDAQTEAKVDDATEAMRQAMGSLEAGVIIELGEAWLAEALPMCGQGREHRSGREGASLRACGETAVEGNGIKDLHLDAPLDGQTLHKVEV